MHDVYVVAYITAEICAGYFYFGADVGCERYCEVEFCAALYFRAVDHCCWHIPNFIGPKQKEPNGGGNGEEKEVYVKLFEPRHRHSVAW